MRTLVDSGDRDAAGKALDRAVETNQVEAFHPQVQQLSREIKTPQGGKPPKPTPAAPSLPPNISEYALPMGPPAPRPPAPPQDNLFRPMPTAQGAAAKPALSPQPAAPSTSPERISRPFLPKTTPSPS